MSHGCKLGIGDCCWRRYTEGLLGAEIRTVNQHDVTGFPWTAVDLLLDSQIEQPCQITTLLLFLR